MPAQQQPDERAKPQTQQQPPDAQKLDRAAIHQVLEDYRSAFERRNLKALAAVWPNIPSWLKAQIGVADKIHVTLDQQEPVFSGDMATVVCKQKVEIVINGKTTPDDHSRQFTLKKTNGRWVIEQDK